jgi:hypothetical protein
VIARTAALLRVGLTAAAVALAGCQTVGPANMQRDRMDYAGAIADSWKEQMLLNITKLRYFDTPVFLDVSSVVSSYSVQTELGLVARIFPNKITDTYRNFGATGIFIDRPTISYTPVTGKKYTDTLLRPIPPQAVFAMMQAGHQADFVLRGVVRAINGVHNASASPSRAKAEDPAFERTVGALRRLQQAGAIGMRITRRGGDEVTFIYFDERTGSAQQDVALLRELLNLDPDAKELLLTFGSLQRNRNEIALLSRSILEILVEFSGGVDVPEQHLSENRAAARALVPETRRKLQPLAHIRSSTERPTDAYTAVRYRDHWFWVDDRDIYSKRAFSFLMMFSSIAETGIAPQAPIITIPAN